MHDSVFLQRVQSAECFAAHLTFVGLLADMGPHVQLDRLFGVVSLRATGTLVAALCQAASVKQNGTFTRNVCFAFTLCFPVRENANNNCEHHHSLP